MKVIKPHKLGIISRTYTFRGEHTLAVAPLAFFRLSAPGELLNEYERWPEIMPLLGQDVLDEGMPKANGEFLLVGDAHAPDGHPVDSLDVAVHVGEVTKTLRVMGHGVWRRRLFRFSRGARAPFTSMPLTWANATGAEKDERNPEGIDRVDKREDQTVIGLPTVLPRDKGTAATDAGFAPIAITRTQRSVFNGTYDGRWTEERFPNLADDTDFRLFNRAAPDQQFPAFLTGGESFRLENVHPTAPVLQGNLPDYRVRAFVRSVDEGASATEVPLHLETVWFLPQQDLGVLVYRGVRPVADAFGLDVSDLLLAYENHGDNRPLAHYASAIDQRSHPKLAMAHALNVAQLSPVKSPEQLAAEEKERFEELARLKREQAEMLAEAADPDGAAGLAPLPVPDIDPDLVIAPSALESNDFDAERLVQAADRALETARADAVSMTATAASAELPQQEGDDHADRVERATSPPEDKQAELLEVAAGMEGVDAGQLPPKLEAAPMHTNADKATFSIPEETRQAIRAIVITKLAEAGSFVDCDFSGADLSGLDFSGCDLSGAAFDGCVLNDCVFTDTTLDRTSLVEATLVDTTFAGCRLDRANISGADLTLCAFADCVFTSVQMVKTCISHSTFDGGSWQQVNAYQARFLDCEFHACNLSDIGLIEGSLRDSGFHSCEVVRLVGIQASFQGAAFIESSLGQSVFADANLRLASFDDSRLKGCQFAGEQTAATASRWAGAELETCGLRGLKASQSVFRGSRFRNCDLSEADLTETCFEHAVLYECLMFRTNCHGAGFDNASLAKTRLSEARLSRCALGETDFFEADALSADFTDTDYRQCRNLMPLKARRLARERRIA